MDAIILKALLTHDTFNENKSRLNQKLFDSPYSSLFSTLAVAHDKYESDVTAEGLMALYTNQNPLSTHAQLSEMSEVVSTIKDAGYISKDICADLVEGLWKRSIGTGIANLGLGISEGDDAAWDSLVDTVEKHREGFLPQNKIEFTTSDIDELLSAGSDVGRFPFNLKPLAEKVYGIGRAEFMSVFAVPNVGKTAFMLTLCASPGGFAEQGLKVLYLVNEEASQRTKLRAIMSYTGMSSEDIELDKRTAVEKYDKIDGNLKFLDIHEHSMEDLDYILSIVPCDVVVIDQLDKVNIKGTFGAGHERLRELYRQFREFAKRNNCAVIGMSQASNEARGKTKITPFEMEGSKIGKMAELDLCIGIGALESGDVVDSEPDMTRYLTVGKNKLNGWHGTVACMLDAGVSRYVV